MKLDKRIIEGKRPLTCFDSEFAKQFISKEGFFTDELESFCDLDKLIKTELRRVCQNESECFMTRITGYKYFLPYEWVKEPEPVWKPYDLDSWRNDGFMIGSVITFRIKPKNNPGSKTAIVRSLVYLGNEEHSGDSNDIYIYIGTLGYSFKYLFENYEIFDDKYEKPNCPKWRPFGCQE